MNREKPSFKTRAWVLLLCGIVVLCVLASLLPHRKPGLNAGIYVDGVCVQRVNLDRVTEEQRYLVEGYGGSNLVVVQPGRICVEAADCPDQICVMQGWLPDSGLPIVCLPHHLVIQLEGASP